MTPIKIILAVLLLVILRVFLVQKLTLVRRVVAFLMFFMLLFLVILPDTTTVIANGIGVDRGSDLIFYLSHLFLLFLIVVLWRRYTALMGCVTRLTQLCEGRGWPTPYSAPSRKRCGSVSDIAIACRAAARCASVMKGCA